LPKTVLLAALVSAALIAAGCGGTTDPKVDAKPVTAKQSSDTDVAAAKKVVVRFMAAFADGDGKSACNQMTDKAVAGMVQDGKKRSAKAAFDLCVDTISGLHGLMGPEDVKALQHPKFKSVKVKGDSAVVTVTYTEEPVELVRTEGSGWLIDGGLD
jgi:hypothetical protein